MTENKESITYEKGFMLIPEESIGPCVNCGNGIIIKFCRKYRDILVNVLYAM